MNTRLKIAASSSRTQFTRASFAGLRRECPCAGSGGKCELCRKKEATLQRETSGHGGLEAARLGTHWTHDFGRMRVRPNSWPSDSVQTSRELTPEENPGPRYSAHGVLKSRQAGCQNGGGESVCNPDNGHYEIVSNGNTCCTKDCTQQHEQLHVDEFTASGCCRALSTAYNAPGADKNAAIDKYNAWFAVADPVSECHAYRRSVTCADGLAKSKDCDGKGKGTDCCKSVAEYKGFTAGKAKTTCDSAAAKMPPCPAF
jgi:hypothetical protein